MSAARYLTLLLLLLGGCTMLQQARSPELDAERRLQLGLASLDAGLYQEAFDDLAWVYTRCAGHSASHEALAGLAALELDPRNPAGRESIGSELLGRLVRHPGPPDWTRPLHETTYLLALALGAAPATGAADTTAPGPTTAGPLLRAAARSDTAAAAPADTAAAEVPEVTEVPADTSAAAAAAAEPADRTPPRPAREAVPVPVEGSAVEAVYGCGPRVERGDWVAPQLPGLPGPSVMAILSHTEAERATLASRTDSLAEALATTRRQLEETRAELERIRKTLKP